MAHSYTTHYLLQKSEYLSFQTADPPAPSDNAYLPGEHAAMDKIDTELFKAETFRAALAAQEGLLYHDGLGNFSHVTLSPLFERAPITGQYYCLCGPFASPLTTIAGVANRIQLHPCFALFNKTGSPVTLNLSIMVTVAVAGSAKIVVYAADPATQVPTTRLGESGTVATDTVGVKTIAVALTGVTSLVAGTRLWVGVRTSSTATCRAVSLESAYSFGGVGTVSGQSFGTVLRRTVTFTSAAPNPWVYNAAELTLGITPYAVFVSA